MNQSKSKHFFVADVHLGVKVKDPFDREKSFVDWLGSISSEAVSLYLLGDIFDFWWEYKYVVPKGYVRVLGTLARMVDSGVSVHFFKGNHDQWGFGYLQKEVGVQLHHEFEVKEIGAYRFCLGHGDGPGLTNGRYRLLSGLFSSSLLQKGFASIHPRWGMALGHLWSAHNRKKYNANSTYQEEDDPRYKFARSFPHSIDYFIFGHLHVPADVILPNGSRMVVLGEWMPDKHYAVFDEHTGLFSCMNSRSVSNNKRI